jgi:hypothetical protein
MKKLLYILLFALIPSHIFGIVIDPLELKPIILFFPSDDPDKPEEDTFPYEIKKKILLELAQNVHYRVRRQDPSSRTWLANKIIGYVSFVNKDLYAALDQQRNNPITARNIITNLKYQCPNQNLAWNLKFPGAKKCYELSEQLYNDDLTEEMAENLFQQGAIIDYSVTKNKKTGELQYCPLKYWCDPRRNNNQGKEIIKKLLDLGANPDEENCLVHVIHGKGIDMTKTVLAYKPMLDNPVWNAAILYVTVNNNSAYIDLLISRATHDELNIGLICCFGELYDTILYRPTLMQKFINNGANPNIALPHLLNRLKSIENPFDADGHFVQNLKFFCEQKAFDKYMLIYLQQTQNSLNSLVNALEKNQPDINVQK